MPPDRLPAPLLKQEMAPMIHISCQRVPVPGEPHKFTLGVASINVEGMPAGASSLWDTVHELLCAALGTVKDEVRQQAQGQQGAPLVQSYCVVPGGQW